MPIVWNEPVSFLQRFTENVLYSYLLDRADECNDPIMRMQVNQYRHHYSIYLFYSIESILSSSLLLQFPPSRTILIDYQSHLIHY